MRPSDSALTKLISDRRTMIMTSSLPEPGTEPLVAALLDHFQSLPHLSDLSPDPLIFSAILLNLIVNRGGLIVDLPGNTDAKRKSRAVHHIASISRSIFGRRTHVTTLNEDIGPHMLEYRFWDDPSQGVADTIVCTGIEDISGPTRLRLVDILLKRRLTFGPQATAAMPLPSGAGDTAHVPFPDDLLFIWVRDAGRPDPPGWFIDQFASSIPSYPNDLPSTPRGSPSEELRHVIPREYIANLRRLLDYTHIHPPLSVHLSNLLSALSAHPRLQATLTSRAVSAFPLFVRAHRLISAPFDIPAGWDEALRRRVYTVDGTHTDRFGVGGGKGGVDTWARAAGEEPPVSDLSLAGLEEGYDYGWYANEENVNGVWSLCMRHRVKARRRRGEVMWLLQGGAADEVDTEVDVKRKGDAEVDQIMDDILQAI